MESLKEKAKALLQQCEVVTLTSINKEGYPRPVRHSEGREKQVFELVERPYCFLFIGFI